MPQSQISTLELALLTIFVPLAVFCIGGMISAKRSDANWKIAMAEVNAGFLGLLTTYGTCCSTMEFFKKTVGCPRPNFYSLAALGTYDPVVYKRYSTSGGGEGFKNAPSGHASLAIACFLYLSLYLTSKCQGMFKFSASLSPVANSVRVIALTASQLPFFFGIWIASTRLQDYWHSNGGLAFGMLLGTCCAIFSWCNQALPFMQLQWADTDTDLTALPETEMLQKPVVPATPSAHMMT